MSEPVVVATDANGMYLRIAKGKIIYLSDSENLDRRWCPDDA